jgi:OOP family OmpA-OmpF porin
LYSLKKSTAVNTYLKLTTIAVLLLAPFAAIAEKGEWYIAPSVAYTDDDGDRKIDDSVGGIQFQVGRSMSEHFSLEGLLGYHDIDGFPGQKHLELGVNAIGNLMPDSRFSPYFIGGIGYLRADVDQPDFGGLPAAGTTASSPTGTAGVGLLARFGDSRWSLRAEWRLRRTFDSDDSLTDQVGSIGLQYRFGDSSDSAPAIPLVNDAPEAPADTDNDGVPDSSDDCPNTPAGVAVDSSGCIPDSDSDGVADNRDKCAGTAPGTRVDAAGCEEVRFETVFFDTESAALDASATGKLDEAAELLTRNPQLEVEIAGHADARGPEDYNMRLSVKRAEAVRGYLAQKGVAGSRMTVRGFGESQPAASNETASGQADNRRVEIHAADR